MIKEYILTKNYYSLRKGTKIAYVGETIDGLCVFSHKNWIGSKSKLLDTSKPIYEGYKGGGYKLTNKDIFRYLKLDRGEMEDCYDKLKYQVKHNIYKLREMRDSLNRTVPENLIKVDCLNDEIRRLKQLEFLYGENALGKRITR